MGELSDFRVGQTVELQDGRAATVQFVGSAHFAAGDWIGVELEDATGKNDGSVQGERYFGCEPGHGMFVRPAAATVTAEPAPKPVRDLNGKTNGTTSRARPQSAMVSGLRRQSMLDPMAAKRQSINAGSPTPSARGVRSPSKSPTKQLASSASSGNATPRTSTPPTTLKPSTTLSKPRASISARPSMGPPAVLPMKPKGPLQSIAGTLNGAPKPSGPASLSSTRNPSNRLALRPGVANMVNSTSGGSQGSTGSRQQSPAGSQEPGALSPHDSDVPKDQSRDVLSPALSHASTASRATKSPKPALAHARVSPTDTKSAPPTSTAASREIEDLKTKLRMMERKRMEDREKLKALEKIQGERDKFESIIQKLQAKYQPQQQEIVELRKQLKEAEAKVEAVEIQQAEHDTVVEMATLDREMAEETAESLKTELDALRQKHEEMELEVEILREENQELGKEISPEEKTSQGWIQMERNNERLREALMRLRDITQQQGSELKDQVKELERDLQGLGAVKEQYNDTKQRLAQADAAIEDLRQQLDTALGAEEMIEELTEKNLALNEQIDELRAAIEDLESLKELNDELEINHVETEKQMQEEIDYKETVLTEQTKKSTLQDETIGDLEYTVARFRELVTNMQSDLEDMRASQQISETEANDLTNRSRAMMDLNMRLQVSASKAQVKAIDLELRRMEAQESAEHLAIVQLFLPEAFDNSRDSMLALLRFKRIGFKASLMHGFIKERVQNQAPAGQEDSIFACCDILDKLTWVSAMCDRFIGFIQTCSLEAFGRLEGALYDLEPVERAFNGWIDRLKRDELKEEQCAIELHRSIALMTHLGEVHIIESLERYADDIYMRGLYMQSQLENAAAALSQVKSMARTKLPLTDDDTQESAEFAHRADSLISQIRSAKVVTSKAIHQLSELKSRSLTLNPSTMHIFEATQTLTSSLASSTRAGGHSLFALLNEEGRTVPFTYSEIITSIDPNDDSPFSSLTSSVQAATSQVQTLHTLTTTLSQTIEFTSPRPPPPWQLLAQNLRAASTHSASHETEVGRLKDELAEKNTTLAMREKVVDEMGVKVEVLEKRAGEAGGRRERVRELENVVERANAAEKELTKKLKRMEEELKNFEVERENWKKTNGAHPPGSARTGGKKAGGSSDEGEHVTSAATAREIESLRSEIHALQGAIRYLRSSNHRLLYPPSSPSSALDNEWLSKPLISKPSPAEEKQRLLQTEGKDVLKELLCLVTKEGNGVVKLRDRTGGEMGGKGRLGWRPVRETSRWQAEKQREEWERWREWMHDVGSRGRAVIRERERKVGSGGVKNEALVNVQVRLPGWDDGKYGAGGEVRIATPGEWEEFAGGLGLA